ncbi:MAG: HEAT repeat domain-containing protein [Myxococcota bacterium]|nr:HEAT repeat domain-containing protein [Myxococcota bacterium]
MARPSRHLLAAACAASVCLLLPTLRDVVGGQDRATLVRLLRTSEDFRVRVRAAFALGTARDPIAVAALEQALADPNPAVRAAAAASLARVGSTSSVPALQRATRDSSAAVRMQAERAIRAIEGGPPPSELSVATTAPSSGGSRGLQPGPLLVPTEASVRWSLARWVVTVGDMSNRSGRAWNHLGPILRSEVARHLRATRGVVLLESASIDAETQREIARRALPTLRLDGSVLRVERRTHARDLSVRCEVSLVLLDARERSLRGELRGAATGSEPARGHVADQERRLAEQALAGAVRSAMANASVALARAAGG